MLGIFLFASTTFVFLRYTEKQVRAEYSKTLQILFKAVKPPSRHDGSESVTTVFAQRKNFFQREVRQWLNLATTQKKVPLFIHVVGTKGKGSTCEYLRCGLQSYGLRVGVFSSPHIHTARERIKVGDKLISMLDVNRLGAWALDTLSPARMGSEGAWVVFFDYLLCMALKYFEEEQVDAVVLEAGVGGRFDSTNFIDEGYDGRLSTQTTPSVICVPLITAIAHISLDHQSVLGYTIEEIAWQKCGAIKKGGDVFTCKTYQAPAVMRIIREECAKVGATLHEVTLGEADVAADFASEASALPISRHQYDVAAENRALSFAILQHVQTQYKETLSIDMDCTVTPEHAFREYYWPCRMDTFDLPFADQANGGSDSSIGVRLILDGCHNGYSVQRFTETVQRSAKLSDVDRPRTVITLLGVGVEKKDNIAEMAASVCAASDIVILVRSKHFKAMAIDKLREAMPSGNEAKQAAICVAGVPKVGGVLSRAIGRRKICVRSAADVTASDQWNTALATESMTIAETLDFLLLSRQPNSGPMASLMASGRGVDGVSIVSSLIDIIKGGGNCNREVLDTRRVTMTVCGSLFAAGEAREWLFKRMRHVRQCDGDLLFRDNDWAQYSETDLW